MFNVRVAAALAVAVGALSGCSGEAAGEFAPTVTSDAPTPSTTSDSSRIGSPSRTVTATRTRIATAPQRTIWKTASAHPTKSAPDTQKTTGPVTATSTPIVHTPTVDLVDSDIFQAGTYGPVQISVVIVDGVITDITMLQQPDSNSHSRDLTRIVFPNLIANVVESQSNSLTISGVTGASYDFAAFKQALQSVLTKAGL